jgi:hypothetical protein
VRLLRYKFLTDSIPLPHGRAAARRAEYQEKDFFEEGHIAVVWDELEDRFGVNSKGWKKKFDDAFMQQPHHVERR